MNQGNLPYGRVVDYILGPTGEYLGWVEVGVHLAKNCPPAVQRYTAALPRPTWIRDPSRRKPGELDYDGDEFFDFIVECPHPSIVRKVLDGGHPLWLRFINEALRRRTLAPENKNSWMWTKPEDSFYEDAIGDAFALEYRTLMDQYGVRLNIDESRALYAGYTSHLDYECSAFRD